MAAERVSVSDLDHEQRAHVARAIEGYDVAREDPDRRPVSLSDDPEAVAERVRYSDGAVELRRDPDGDVDEVRYVLRALDYQLEKIDEGKPDADEDRERAESKSDAMTDRAHLFEAVREQAADQGVTYAEDEVRASTE